MAPKKALLECYDDGNLDLSLTGIQEIPVRDIAAIPKAINLDLSSNVIVSIPKAFATSLTHLVKLDLSQNQISKLPDNFGLLVNLKHLDLDNNKIVSLPLSFGKLKNLRWLDLKRNPLLPKLAEIAGLCQDTQQCQAAARNVVENLRALQEKVNTEMARRKEAAERAAFLAHVKSLDSLIPGPSYFQQAPKPRGLPIVPPLFLNHSSIRKEIVEESIKKINKDTHSSKKKKKKIADAADNNVNNVHANGKTHSSSEEDKNYTSGEGGDSLPSVPILKTDKKPNFFRKVVNTISTIIKLAVITVLFAVFCGFLLSLFNEDLYTSLQKRGSEIITSNIPKHYLKHWNNAVLVSRRAITNWSSQVIAISIHYFNKIHEYYVTLSSDERIQHYLEGFQKGWHILWIWLNETYASLSAELPRRFIYFKKVLSEWSTTK